MNNSFVQRLNRPMTLTCLVLIVTAMALYPMASSLGEEASLLPIAMLLALSLLSVMAIISDQRKVDHEEAAEPLLKSPLRAYGGLFSVLVFIVSVHLFGFYLTTAVFVPLIAHLFGCKSPKALLIAAVLVTGLIFVVFDYAMAKEFPIGLLWEEAN